eukprot:TRINITY_DN14632_c0_g1_i7.p1 TRINITY_DN14632_c0_g1~~TRINITY_DN14632_c0_g1_i7.p1  ORF type:complete len:493 (+),score=102.00 TRINITY_DN14632_c0_g1_i7:201-1679(+)
MKAILLMLALTLAEAQNTATDFFAIYDLGKPTSGETYSDLLGSGPDMSAQSRAENGILLSQYKEDWLATTGNMLEIDYGKRDAVTVVTMFKPTVCENSKFLIWAWVDSIVNPRCGLLCFNDFEWKLGCKDMTGKNYFSSAITLEKEAMLTLALVFTSIEEDMALTLLWKENNNTPSQFTQRFSAVNYKEFTSKTKLSYAAYRGELYYLAFLQSSLDLTTFAGYVGYDNHIALTPNCPNCPSQDFLSCPNTNINLVPHYIREYYCSCGVRTAYDLDIGDCAATTTSCYLPCSLGCIANKQANCVLTCPSPFVVREVKGDYSLCECEGGGVKGKDGGWCKDEKKRAAFWFLTIGLPLIAIALGVVAFVIYKYWLYLICRKYGFTVFFKKVVDCCCKKKADNKSDTKTDDAQSIKEKDIKLVIKPLQVNNIKEIPLVSEHNARSDHNQKSEGSKLDNTNTQVEQKGPDSQASHSEAPSNGQFSDCLLYTSDAADE